MNGKYSVLISVTLLALVLLPTAVRAAVTYDFTSDTIGATPANVTVGAGTFDVQNQVTLGKSMRAVTQAGVIAAANFDSFASTTDQSVVWKQAYSNNLGRGGFTLRAQSEDTGVANSAGAKKGYLFQVYESNAVYIWRVGDSTYTALWSGTLAKAQPRWFKALAMGNSLGFYYSDDGVTYTRLASTTDSAYPAGKVQYTAGYGASVNYDYVDDIVITDLAVPSTPASSGGVAYVIATPPAPRATAFLTQEGIEVQGSYVSQNILIDDIGVRYTTDTASTSMVVPVTSGRFTHVAFTHTIPTLTCGTLYTVQAYARNAVDTTYSAPQQITTPVCPQKPVTHDETSVRSAASSTAIMVPTSNAHRVRNLTTGMQGDDVRALQQLLNASGYALGKTGPGSPGNESVIFSTRTKSAVAAYQKANRIVPANGYFGPVTRASMKQKSLPGIWW